MTKTAFEMGVSTFGASLSTQLPNPASLCVTQQEFAHDIATLEWWGGDATSDALSSGMPIYISFGSSPTLRSFYGYVNHAKRVNNAMASSAMGRNALCVTAVGASWPMKDCATTAYKNMTSTQIVEQIAAQFGLDANVVPHPTIWPVKNQGGQSYWAFCVKLMQEIGYTFYCNGIQLVAKPRNTSPNNLSSLSAIYDYRTNPLGLPVFSPVVGSNNPTGGQLRNRQLAGVDPRTNQIIFSSVGGSNTSQVLGVTQDTPPFAEIQWNTVDSTNELTTKLQGAAQDNQLYLTASAVGTGNALMAQGSYVFVQNANGGWNGLWFTTKVKHEMTPQNYQMKLMFGRDSIGSTNSYRVMVNNQSPPKARLINLDWQAAA